MILKPVPPHMAFAHPNGLDARIAKNPRSFSRASTHRRQCCCNHRTPRRPRGCRRYQPGRTWKGLLRRRWSRSNLPRSRTPKNTHPRRSCCHRRTAPHQAPHRRRKRTTSEIGSMLSNSSNPTCCKRESSSGNAWNFSGPRTPFRWSPGPSECGPRCATPRPTHSSLPRRSAATHEIQGRSAKYGRRQSHCATTPPARSTSCGRSAWAFQGMPAE
mmetsp:Transcript_32597/g.98529  ORF Transcript_32597/g.98529 Transcript_32597/m.98529 type:complete len:215 (-) Transcript_32597:79-723(-)